MPNKKAPRYWEKPVEKGFNHLLGYSLEYSKVKNSGKENKILPVNLPKINNHV